MLCGQTFRLGVARVFPMMKFWDLPNCSMMSSLWITSVGWLLPEFIFPSFDAFLFFSHKHLLWFLPQTAVGEYVQIYGYQPIWNRCIFALYASQEATRVSFRIRPKFIIQDLSPA